jgi:hypothetical protein
MVAKSFIFSALVLLVNLKAEAIRCIIIAGPDDRGAFENVTLFSKGERSKLAHLKCRKLHSLPEAKAYLERRKSKADNEVIIIQGAHGSIGGGAVCHGGDVTGEQSVEILESLAKTLKVFAVLNGCHSGENVVRKIAFDEVHPKEANGNLCIVASSNARARSTPSRHNLDDVFAALKPGDSAEKFFAGWCKLSKEEFPLSTSFAWQQMGLALVEKMLFYPETMPSKIELPLSHRDAALRAAALTRYPKDRLFAESFAQFNRQEAVKKTAIFHRAALIAHAKIAAMWKAIMQRSETLMSDDSFLHMIKLSFAFYDGDFSAFNLDSSLALAIDRLAGRDRVFGRLYMSMSDDVRPALQTALEQAQHLAEEVISPAPLVQGETAAKSEAELLAAESTSANRRACATGYIATLKNIVDAFAEDRGPFGIGKGTTKSVPWEVVIHEFAVLKASSAFESCKQWARSMPPSPEFEEMASRIATVSSYLPAKRPLRPGAVISLPIEARMLGGAVVAIGDGLHTYEYSLQQVEDHLTKEQITTFRRLLASEKNAGAALAKAFIGHDGKEEIAGEDVSSDTASARLRLMFELLNIGEEGQVALFAKAARIRPTQVETILNEFRVLLRESMSQSEFSEINDRLHRDGCRDWHF